MDTKYEQGLALLKTIGGEHANRLLELLEDTAPGFSKALISFAFADVCGRPGLDLRTRELATIAALATLGTAAPQLRLHIGGALNLGCTETEITEILVQTSLYAGIPATLNGLAIAREVFQAREVSPAPKPMRVPA